METRQFACEGPICRPKILLTDDMAPEYKTINSCVANLVDNKWLLPPGWYVVKDKLHCPRCMRKKYPDSKLEGII